jgi:ubiquinone/menaquinone biosynthesis C-methylase UbiE
MFDVCGDAVFAGNFEEAERQFMERFLKPNMIVLDIGAHHGFYTLLASHKVGPTGQVIAFEPLPAGVSTASLAFALEPKEKCLGGTFCFREP